VPNTSYLWVGLTVPFDLTGTPAVSVPCGFAANGLPMGLQVTGRAWDEATILRVAAAYEAATPWHERHPSL
jgi:aspartyl-tRNA(Asn)/glutamyl-tRNA(Gln) amidotransferase subunit A